MATFSELYEYSRVDLKHFGEHEDEVDSFFIIKIYCSLFFLKIILLLHLFTFSKSKFKSIQNARLSMIRSQHCSGFRSGSSSSLMVLEFVTLLVPNHILAFSL